MSKFARSSLPDPHRQRQSSSNSSNTPCLSLYVDSLPSFLVRFSRPESRRSGALLTEVELSGVAAVCLSVCPSPPSSWAPWAQRSSSRPPTRRPPALPPYTRLHVRPLVVVAPSLSLSLSRVSTRRTVSSRTQEIGFNFRFPLSFAFVYEMRSLLCKTS